MSEGANLQKPAILTSWKEIAAYLGKGVRTVQRWEAEFGLPVQRPFARDKGIVHAKREDLDAWLAQNWRKRHLDEEEVPRRHEPNLSKVFAEIESAKRLREQQRVLVAKMHEAMAGIHDQCEKMASSLGRYSRTRPAK